MHSIDRYRFTATRTPLKGRKDKCKAILDEISGKSYIWIWIWTTYGTYSDSSGTHRIHSNQRSFESKVNCPLRHLHFLIDLRFFNYVSNWFAILNGMRIKPKALITIWCLSSVNIRTVYLPSSEMCCYKCRYVRQSDSDVVQFWLHSFRVELITHRGPKHRHFLRPLHCVASIHRFSLESHLSQPIA